MKTGELIKNARTDLGWTQKKLAKKIEMTQQQLSQYERGERVPSLMTLKRIASALGCDPDTLRGDDMKPISFHSDISKLFIAPEHYLNDFYNYKLMQAQNAIRLFEHFDKLNALGQRVAIQRLAELTMISAYTKKEEAPVQEQLDQEEEQAQSDNPSTGKRKRNAVIFRPANTTPKQSESQEPASEGEPFIPDLDESEPEK